MEDNFKHKTVKDFQLELKLIVEKIYLDIKNNLPYKDICTVNMLKLKKVILSLNDTNYKFYPFSITLPALFQAIYQWAFFLNKDVINDFGSFQEAFGRTLTMIMCEFSLTENEVLGYLDNFDLGDIIEFLSTDTNFFVRVIVKIFFNLFEGYSLN